ncbi:MAG: LacI family DNA-binding transcriptional regulator [Fibrobacteres bacterium]|nr:LacI family DNA-binding transcriptional regulator [Fibrobacterota bacterium]
MVGLKDIADKTGFSIRTVARVINNNPNVNSETREKVQKIVDELKYRPHFAARSLKLRRTNIIGIVRYRTHVDPDNRRITLISQQLAEAGYSILQGIYRDDESRGKLIDHFRNVCDAIIMSPSSHEESLNDYEKMAAEKYPFVILDPSPETPSSFNTVRIDRAHGIADAVETLVNSGKKNILYLTTGKMGLSRLEGIKEGLRRKGLQLSSENILSISQLSSMNTGTITGLNDEYETAMEAGYRLILENSAIGRDYNALFCYNDALAIGCMRGLYEKGIKVPEQVAVIGFDNVLYSKHTYIPLSTVAQPIEKPASAVVENILAQLHGSKTETQVFPTEFVKRASC